RNLPDLFRRSGIYYANSENNPAAFLSLIVMNDRFHQLSIGHHQLLTVRTANMGCFDTNLFHGAGMSIGDNEIADFKGLVEKDNEITEKVAQYILRSQGDGDTTHTQTGNNGSNIIPQVVD